MKLIEKKDRDKRLIKNWRSTSLLNTDLKIFSKPLSAAKLKSVLLSLIVSHKTACVQIRYVGGGRRLIYDVLDISDRVNVDGYLALSKSKELSAL